MASDLPEEFDVIVLGTGLPESLLAAAISRIGLSVLHLDRNNYYSGSWASFSLRSVPEWMTQQKTAACYVSGVDQDKLGSLLKEGEKALQLPETFSTFSQVASHYHVGERPQEEMPEPPASSQPAASTSPQTETSASDADAKISAGAQSTTPRPDQGVGGQTVDESQPGQSDSASEKSGDIVPGQFDSASEEGDEQEEREGRRGEGSDQAQQGAAAPETKKEEEGRRKSAEKKCRQWFKEDVAKEWRKFSFDLAPKLLYCGGSMVELLIKSDVAKYCEFRTVSRVLTLRDGNLEKVPCSRADVFGSKALSLVEKRLLMKFLTFAVEYDTHTQEYQDFVGKPFVEFLESRKLSYKLQHFIVHSIAMATEATPTEQGLEAIQKFLRSLGRYGNTAFLFPLYGSGELPQAFCRFSAVFGGIYVLTLSVSHLLVDGENKCTGVITSSGQRIGCKYLIADPSYLLKEFYHVPEDRHISRGIFVTDGSIFPGEGEDLSLLQFPHEGQLSSPTTTVLELPPSAMVSPRPLHMVHMTRGSVSDVETDLQPTVSTLLDDTREEGAQAEAGNGAGESTKPRVLWSLTFRQKDLSVVMATEQMPSNVFVVNGPGMELDTDRCVSEARSIFKQLCPEEEFLPKPPHPDDIIYVDTEEVSTADNDKGEWAADATDDAGSAPSQDSAQSADPTGPDPTPSQDTAQSAADGGKGEEKEGSKAGGGGDEEGGREENQACEGQKEEKHHGEAEL